MTSSIWDTARYLNLATFRKTGVAVQTPVWFAKDGDVLYAFSTQDAGKVKRLRNSSRARIAPCTVTGKLTGDWVDAEAFLLDPETGRNTAYKALRSKYGLQMLLLDIGAFFAGRINKRAWIAIRLKSGS
jgi:PPOX class probable F420-dependent enzyme